MIRLATRILPWALVAFGLLFILTGAVTLVGETETHPTSMSIQSLMTDGSPTKEYVKLTDGGIYWPEYATPYRHNAESEESGKKPIAHFVPVVAREDVPRWIEATQAGAKRPDVRRLVYVRLTPEAFVKTFPDVARNAISDDYQPFELEGTLVPASLWPREFKTYVRDTVGMAADSVLVVDYGSKPLQKNEAAGLVVMSLPLTLGGGFWIRKRRRSAGAMNQLCDAAWTGAQAGLGNAVESSLRPAPPTPGRSGSDS